VRLPAAILAGHHAIQSQTLRLQAPGFRGKPGYMASSLRWRRHRFDGRVAWQLENDRLRLQLLEGGGHVASIELLGRQPPAGINPLWKPPWPSMEPYRFSMARHGRAYGSNPESRLLSGIRGHNVCFDYWGAPSAEEAAAGLSFHGEAGVLRWTLREARSTKSQLVFTCAAEMKMSAARFSRTVRLVHGETAAYFEETAENLTALDRAMGWVEHVTIGPPFLRRGETRLGVAPTRGYSLPGCLGRVPSETEFHWPYVRAVGAGEEKPVDLRIAAPEARSGFVLSMLIDPGRALGFTAAATPRLRLLLAYVFKRADFPWVNMWEQNRKSTIAPWRRRALAVGLEFGNTIVAGSRRAMAAFGSKKYGAPAYGWLPARASRTVRYIALLAEVPRDFLGVADIRCAADGLNIAERDTSREIRVPCDTSFLA
jgi:hypothetical protein